MGKLYLGSSKVTPFVQTTSSVLSSTDVTPTTSAQTITPPTGVDGFNQVNVSAVDSTIDSNIQAGNIKSGVSILGISGNVTELVGETVTIDPTTSQQTITPTTGNGITSATVNAVTSSIDSNIVAGNIKKDINILGVTGTFEGGITPTGTVSITTNGSHDVTNYATADVNVPGATLTTISVTPSTSSQTITPPTGYDGFDEVDVSAVDHTIDANITAGNIKKDVAILGVTGTYEGTVPTGTISITANGTGIDVSNYASADVNVPFVGISKTINGGVLENTSALMDLSTVTHIGSGVMSHAYFQNILISGAVDLSSLEEVGEAGLDNAFYSANYITSIDLSGLTSVSPQGAYAFHTAFRSLCSNCVNLTSFDLSNLTEVTANDCFSYAFYNTGVTTASFPALTRIDGSYSMNYILSNCTSLTSVSFPSLEYIGNGGLENMCSACNILTSINFPALQTVGEYGLAYAFNACSDLTTASFPALTTATGTYSFVSAFSTCGALTTISFPVLTSTGDYCFAYLAQNSAGTCALTSIDFSALATIGEHVFEQAFMQQEYLTTISFPALTALPSSTFYYAFHGCTRLTTVSLPAVTSITGDSTFVNAFGACPLLSTVTIGSAGNTITFGSSTDYFINMFDGCTNDITLNIATTQAVMETMEGYDTSGQGHHFSCPNVVTINYL